MTSLTNFMGLCVLPVTPTPAPGGKAISDDFRSLITWNPKSSWAQPDIPTTSQDIGGYFYPGSQWSQVVSGTQTRIFVCRSNASGAAVWDELLVNPSLYALLGGVLGGQTLNGGTASGDNLTLSSTANAMKGKILFGSLSAYDEANTRLGIGTTSPAATLHLSSNETQSNWGTAGIGLRIDAATYTDSSGTGTIDFNAAHAIGTPVLAASNTVHYQDLATLYIAGAPTAGTNVTFSRTFSLLVSSGDGYFGSNLLVGTPDPIGQLTVEQDETNPTAFTYGIYCDNNATITADNGEIYAGIRSLGAATVSSGKSATNEYSCIGVWGVGQVLGAGNVTGIVGVLGNPANNGTGTVTNAYSIYASGVINGEGGVVTNAYGYYTEDQTAGASSGLNVGFAGNVSSGTNKYNLYLPGTAVNYLAGYLGVGTLPVAGQAISATLGNAADKGLVVQGAASQSGNLAEFQNSSGTALAAITSAGRLSFNATGSAPSNTTTPAAWLDIMVAGVAHKLPLYT